MYRNVTEKGDDKIKYILPNGEIIEASDELTKLLAEIKELTPELIHEFIEKIVVSSPRYFDGKRYQIVDIYYNGIGIIRRLTPEDMEEAFERELEQKEKTA